MLQRASEDGRRKALGDDAPKDKPRSDTEPPKVNTNSKTSVTGNISNYCSAASVTAIGASLPRPLVQMFVTSSPTRATTTSKKPWDWVYCERHLVTGWDDPASSSANLVVPIKCGICFV